MAIYRSIDVFTPMDVPKHTYVFREEHDYESQLKQALKTPGQIISLSGPSKSGKTALIKTIIPSDTLIQVSGASITSPENLWQRVLSWMDRGVETTSQTALTFSGDVTGKGSATANVLVAKGTVEATLRGGASHTSTESTKIVYNGLDQVVHEIANSDFIVFIDDFHYMETEVRASVARQIKEIAEKGVKVLTASVPHRSDDVVRGNPELRGRVRAIDFSYWSDKEIHEIPRMGFAALGMELPTPFLSNLVGQAFGSPQLMQQMCLQTCFQLEVDQTLEPKAKLEVSAEKSRRILEQTSTTTDFSSALDAMHAGPKLRGQERRHFDFSDNTTGDVYRSVLLALAKDPPRLSLRYDEIIERVKTICTGGEAPVGSSVSQALEQVCVIAENSSGSRFIEWDEDILDISDPYFLYYLRCSPQLSRLKSPGVE